MVSSKATTIADYLADLPPERAVVVGHVRDLINQAMPDGYREGIGYGMIGWVVPLDLYPGTYNGLPLSYVGLAAQKNHYSLYLNCVYVSPERTERLKAGFAAAGKSLDMGKSCIRFKRVDQLAEDAIATEIASATPAQFVAISDEARRRGGC
ncbi:MAG: DUF1801 domain-containing protein [Sphingomonas bacterium]|nr:DUF1801 domain-containing protein [Sphingomonas bacterium]